MLLMLLLAIVDWLTHGRMWCLVQGTAYFCPQLSSHTTRSTAHSLIYLAHSQSIDRSIHQWINESKCCFFHSGMSLYNRDKTYTRQKRQRQIYKCRGPGPYFFSTSLYAVWQLVSWLVFNGTFSTNRPYHAIGVQNIIMWAGDKTNTQLNEKALRGDTNTAHWL